MLCRDCLEVLCECAAIAEAAALAAAEAERIRLDPKFECFRCTYGPDETMHRASELVAIEFNGQYVNFCKSCIANTTLSYSLIDIDGPHELRAK